MEKYIFVLLFASASCQLNSPARILPPASDRRSDVSPSAIAGGVKDTRPFPDYDYEYSSSPRRQTPKTRNTLTNSDCRIKTRTLPHEKYCDLYYHTTGCENDQSLLRSCPNGLLFTGNGRSGLIGVCDYTHNVDCGGKETHNPPISTDHCDWLYGIFGHETSCTRYWTCWNGTATEQFCVGGLLYNEETHACDWPQNVAGCQKHPLCKDDANGNVPLGKSCNRYWACQGGYPRLQRCPAMLVFDKNRKRCFSPPTEDCDVPSTTSSPETINEEKNRQLPNNVLGDNRRRDQNQFQSNSRQSLPFQIQDDDLRPQNIEQ